MGGQSSIGSQHFLGGTKFCGRSNRPLFKENRKQACTRVLQNGARQPSCKIVHHQISLICSINSKKTESCKAAIPRTSNVQGYD
jgi:hypothetical protein